MLSPQISVIVPVYNTGKYLHRCIDSILVQTFTDFELLLIDDGSKDGSGEICDEYAQKDSRVRVFHKENGGVSSARNFGLDNVRGKWVTFCDSDDWVKPAWLQTFMIYGDEYDLVVQGFETSYEFIQNSKLHGILYEGNIKSGLLELFRNNCLGYLWVKRFKVSIIQKNHLRFDCNIRLQEDELFLLSYAQYCDKMLSSSYYHYYYYPCYENKYKDEHKNNGFYMTETLLKKSLELYGSCNDLVSYYINYYTDTLVGIYERKQKGRSDYLKQYRTVTGKLILKSRLFFITRQLIYLDFSCILSSVLLDIHTKIIAYRKKKQ